MPEHEHFMRRCIEIALLGAGSVSPNPMVGSVIVCRGEIIGEGYHKRYGGPHAEVNAVNDVFRKHRDAAALLRESTLYVSLEPCSHTGKTPPCTELILRHAIPKVVLGALDPFPAVNGSGIARLRESGVEVVEGVLADDCEALNIRFFTGTRKHRPFIILKWAQTNNGFFAPLDRSKKWISSGESQTLVHRWRTEEDAVLVGKRTASADDPALTVRSWKGRDPVRVVVDRRLELPQHLKLFDDTVKTLVINELKTDVVGKTYWLRLENFDHYLPQFIAYQLYLMDIRSVIIEGGRQTIDLFIAAGLWDEARVFVSPDTWKAGIDAPQLNSKVIDSTPVGRDRLFLYRNLHEAAV